jgi:hypothetical protein
VKFLSRGKGYRLFLTPTEAVMSLHAHSNTERSADLTPLTSRMEHLIEGVRGQATPDQRSDETPTAVLRMKLVGANPTPQVVRQDPLPGKLNYFKGGDRKKWRTAVPTFAKVRYANVYPGIDLVYYGNQRQFEYDLVVAPGADAGRIALAFQGVDRIGVNPEGDLVFQVASRVVRQKKPLIYQNVDGARKVVSGKYLVKGDLEFGFELGAYDPSIPLIIDPILVYSTYVGGNGADFGLGIAVDASGNAYITGSTFSESFPTSVAGFQTAAAVLPDAFVAKPNPIGTELIYSSYLGGDSADVGYAVAVDPDGNAHITGRTTDGSIPTTPGAPQPMSGGGYDAFRRVLLLHGDSHRRHCANPDAARRESADCRVPHRLHRSGCYGERRVRGRSHVHNHGQRQRGS